MHAAAEFLQQCYWDELRGLQHNSLHLAILLLLAQYSVEITGKSTNVSNTHPFNNQVLKVLKPVLNQEPIRDSASYKHSHLFIKRTSTSDHEQSEIQGNELLNHSTTQGQSL